MIDINLIRTNPDLIKKTVENKKIKVDVDRLLQLDGERRELISQLDGMRMERNEAAKNRDIEKGKEIKQKLDELEPKLDAVQKEFDSLMILVPNVPFDDVPVGKDESENVVIRKWGEPKQFSFQVKDHVELGELVDGIDIETAAKVTGTRFYYLKGKVVMLQLAIINFVMTTLQDEAVLKDLAAKISPEFSAKPFIPILPPVMIRPDVYTRMGRLDETNKEERYYLQQDDQYLIGSAEHTLGPMHMDQTINEDQLPLRYIGYSTSFRREAGSYGKDTRGILRVHQFDKLEMETFTTAEDSLNEQNFIVSIQEYLLQKLNLPYQVVMICTGDMGGPDARQIDMETWIPSQETYRETHTSDLMTDYQSRRLAIKVRRKDGKTELVHMNDATAFAIGRILIAILENYQREDGTIEVPEVLRPFTGFSEITPK